MNISSKIFIWLFFFVVPLWAQPPVIQLPKNLESWMWAEGHLNDKGRFEDLRDHSILEKRHQAVSSEWFSVPSYWVSEDQLDVAALDEQIPKELRSELIRESPQGREYRLFVHPQSIQFYKKLTDISIPADSVWARATASSRTVLLYFPNHPKSFIFAKLSLDQDLGQVRRTVISSDARQGVGVTVWVQSQFKKLGGKFRFLSEFLGIAPKGWLAGGQILRAIPEEVLTGKKLILPMFSLTAVQKNGKTFLQEMIEESGQSPLEFVHQQILRPFVQEWLRWAIEASYVSELHSQNLLFEKGHDGIKAFYIRDNNGAMVDTQSAFFDASILPTPKDLQNLMVGYDPQEVQDLQEVSLAVYFQERILENINKELLRLDPHYGEGVIQNDLWLELRRQLIRDMGAPKEVVRIERLKNRLPEVLKSVAESYKGSLAHRRVLCIRMMSQ